MKTSRFLFLFLFCPLFVFGQEPQHSELTSSEITVNYKAMLLMSYKNADSARKAIVMLDKAIIIDSNFSGGYETEILLLQQLKEYNKAIKLSNYLIRRAPQKPEVYFRSGVLYEMSGDTISSRTYFEKSLVICNIISDTISARSNPPISINILKIQNLIFLNETLKANELAQALYTFLVSQPDSSIDGNPEKALAHFYINRNKKGIAEFFN